MEFKGWKSHLKKIFNPKRLEKVIDIFYIHMFIYAVCLKE